MKRIVYLIALSVLLFINAGAQVRKQPATPVKEKTESIPDSCTQTPAALARCIMRTHASDEDRIRTLFLWECTQLQYDVPHMFAINFYEKPEEKVAKALATRQAICEGYAHVFRAVCREMGIRCVVVEGYTKQRGFADYIPHAWNAAKIAGEWRIYDPTWGSGYVNNGKFIHKLDEHYYAARGTAIIKSHMPFDYLWQCSSYPITNQDFYDGKLTENKTRPYFSYADSIDAYDLLSPTAQLAAAARRIEENGLKNGMIFDQLHHIKAQLEHEQQANTVTMYNGAVADYNEGVQQLNGFIEYRNKQFQPMRPDAEIQAMLDDCRNSLRKAKDKLAQIHQPESSTAALILQLTKSIDDADSQRLEMQEWLTKYFGKGKLARRSMFYKVTWFGVPVN